MMTILSPRKFSRNWLAKCHVVIAYYTAQRQWRTQFGASTTVHVYCNLKLVTNTTTSQLTAPIPFMGLMFLKAHVSDHVNDILMAVDNNTFRKCQWIIFISLDTLSIARYLFHYSCTNLNLICNLWYGSRVNWTRQSQSASLLSKAPICMQNSPFLTNFYSIEFPG